MLKKTRFDGAFLTRETAAQLANEIEQMGVGLSATIHSKFVSFDVVVCASGELAGICVHSREHWNQVMAIFKAILKEQLKDVLEIESSIPT